MTRKEMKMHLRSKYIRELSWAKQSGSAPDKLLPSMLKCVMAVKPPNEGWI